MQRYKNGNFLEVFVSAGDFITDEYKSINKKLDSLLDDTRMKKRKLKDITNTEPENKKIEK